MKSTPPLLRALRTTQHPAVVAIFFLLVGWFLAKFLVGFRWEQLTSAMLSYSAAEIGLCMLIALASFSLFISFDLMANKVLGHAMSWPRVYAIGFVIYAFTLNLGAIVGSLAFRFRLYTREGMSFKAINKIIGFSILSNRLGQLLVAGAVFVLAPPVLPEEWGFSAPLFFLGLVFLAIVFSYVSMAAFARKRRWKIRRWEFSLPSGKLALAQLVLSGLQWLAAPTILFILLSYSRPVHIDFTLITAAYLLSSFANLIVRTPAGLGVTEVVFVGILRDIISPEEILAGLIVFRLVHQLVPLGIGGILLLALELKQRQEQRELHRSAEV